MDMKGGTTWEMAEIGDDEIVRCNHLRDRHYYSQKTGDIHEY